MNVQTHSSFVRLECNLGAMCVTLHCRSSCYVCHTYLASLTHAADKPLVETYCQPSLILKHLNVLMPCVHQHRHTVSTATHCCHRHTKRLTNRRTQTSQCTRVLPWQRTNSTCKRPHGDRKTEQYLVHGHACLAIVGLACRERFGTSMHTGTAVPVPPVQLLLWYGKLYALHSWRASHGEHLSLTVT